MGKSKFTNIVDKLKEKIKPSKPQPPSEEEVVEEPKTQSLTEYSETLYTADEPTAPAQEYQPDESAYTHQRIWRDLTAIEENIDCFPKHKQKTYDSEVEKHIDKLVHKKPEKKTRTLPNVIYVVTKPTPGQVRGDWAVRSHGKIYSHHRTKQSAIKHARDIAREKNATVLIQNMDGTFSEGFKPRPKD
jgi:hypothetical protein